MAPMTCPNCHSENAPGRRFCGECGHTLAVTCPACGAPNDPVKFCGQCGASLADTTAAAPEAKLETGSLAETQKSS